jgi:hypothetical protein
MPTDIAKQSKPALVRQVETLARSRVRARSQALEMGERISDVIGEGLALATGAAVGAAEGRFRNKDRSPLSLGPVPLPVVVAVTSSVAGVMTGRRSFNYVAAGALGAWGYRLGQGWGAKQLAKSGRKGVSGIGEDWQLNEAEREIVFGTEDD